MTTKPTKPRKKPGPKKKQNKHDRTIEKIRKVTKITPPTPVPTFETPEEMQILIGAYFKECEEKQVPTTVPGLAYALGFVSRQSLWDYSKKKAFSYTLKRAKVYIEAERNIMLLTEQNAAGKIFDLKNNFEWIDSQNLNVNDVTKPKRTPEEIEAMRVMSREIVKRLK